MKLAPFFERYNLTHATGIVAVSGGPDSVALAHLLVQAKMPRLILAHVNHLLRGDESDADEAFVRSLPERWPGIICHTTRIAVAALAKDEADNLEAVARRERYRWFTQLARAEGAAWIATGHTADDQAETVLFRLLRGTGVLGLGAMSPCRRLDDGLSLVRPLLTTRRQTLLDYLHGNQIPYRVDSSNRERRFTRNRLRLELLPTLEREYNPAIVAALCRLAEQAGEIHAETAQHARQLLHEVELSRAGEILVFAADRLQHATPNLIREMFRLVWDREAWPMGEMDFERWQRLVEIVRGSRSAWDFPGKVQARRVGLAMQIQRQESGGVGFE